MGNNMENLKMGEDQLVDVSGGNGTNIPPQVLFIGDSVTLYLYPDYGIGKIVGASVVNGDWQYTAQFAAGTFTAGASEFVKQ